MRTYKPDQLAEARGKEKTRVAMERSSVEADSSGKGKSQVELMQATASELIPDDVPFFVEQTRGRLRLHASFRRNGFLAPTGGQGSTEL